MPDPLRAGPGEVSPALQEATPRVIESGPDSDAVQPLPGDLLGHYLNRVWRFAAYPLVVVLLALVAFLWRELLVVNGALPPSESPPARSAEVRR